MSYERNYSGKFYWDYNLIGLRIRTSLLLFWSLDGGKLARGKTWSQVFNWAGMLIADVQQGAAASWRLWKVSAVSSSTWPPNSLLVPMPWTKRLCGRVWPNTSCWLGYFWLLRLHISLSFHPIITPPLNLKNVEIQMSGRIYKSIWGLGAPGARQASY